MSFGLKENLECGDKAERYLHRTWIRTVVDTLAIGITVEYLGVETFVLGDDKRILDCGEDAETKLVAQQLLPCIAEGDIVATDEGSVLNEIVA